MESAPLTLAHTHARNAIKETQKSNPTAASEEHDLAAGEFASAAKGTSDAEAKRILKLLEQHHIRLAEILKAKPDSALAASLATSSQVHEALPEETPESAPSSQEGPPRPAAHHVPTLNRESSSSLATNLASARGIPANRQRRGNQPLAQVTNQNAEGKLTRPPRRDPASRDPKTRSSLAPSQAQVSKPAVTLSPADDVAPPPPITTANSDDAFARFYSAFTSIRHTLSAPLAFAGLPLQGPTDPNAPETSSTRSRRPTTPPSAAAPFHLSPPPAKNQKQNANTLPDRPNTSPDINRLFSRAALRAIRDENGHAHPSSDSFYVVPSSGGTMSYAHMLQHARQSSNLTDSAEEFVDARETPGSPTTARRPGTAGSSGDKLAAAAEAMGRKPPTIAGIELDPKKKLLPRPGQTYEELYVENGMLKAVAVDLADRLRAFELGAQKSSLALHASMRQFSSPSASTHGHGGGGHGGGAMAGALGNRGQGIPPVPGEQAAVRALDDRVRELEEQVRGLTKENKKLGRENEKLMGVVKRYREKWEALKEGARERIKGGSGGGSGG